MLLVSLIASSGYETDALKNYITPNKTTGCSDGWSTCLTLQEYASKPDKYFTSNAIFYFEPGSHTLNISLNLANIHNFTFQGLPESDSEMPNILLNSLVSITWDDCSNIEVSSITFTLLPSVLYSEKHSWSSCLIFQLLVTVGTLVAVQS